MARSEVGGRTVAGVLRGPLGAFIRAETRGSALVVVAAVAALVWANVPAARYESVWETAGSLGLGHGQLSLTLREWVNSGLMAFFFFVTGLEARREADLGELREARGVVLPVLAGAAGLGLPVAIFLALNAGGDAAHGWGAAMSTDTAFALGVLTVVGPRYAERLRGFVVTVLVVDDVVALVVIAVVYSERIAVVPLVAALGLFLVVLAVRAARVRSGLVYAVLGVGAWVAMHDSGVDPLVVGLAMGLITYAYPAARSDLEQASRQFRQFREQPTGAYARRARASLAAAVSPNDRLAALWHPWSSNVIVPLFALANAGVELDATTLRGAAGSPLTWGIVAGYVVGKPVGITGAAFLVSRAVRGRLRPPVGWGAVGAAGAAAGTAFTVSLLIATLAFTGDQLQHAKIGVLLTVPLAALLSAGIFRAVGALPTGLRVRALLGNPEDIVDLADPVDPERDHVRGPVGAAVTLVEYGDLECPYCGQAEPVVRELLRDFADLTYVWRHLPLDDVHPHARLAAEATEAAGRQGAFWQMHDLLFERQDALLVDDLVRYAGDLGLDVQRFTEDLTRRRYAGRVARDVDGADMSGVGGTPTFFVNGRRHHGAFDLETLSAAVRAAGARATYAG